MWRRLAACYPLRVHPEGSDAATGDSLPLPPESFQPQCPALQPSHSCTHSQWEHRACSERGPASTCLRPWPLQAAHRALVSAPGRWGERAGCQGGEVWGDPCASLRGPPGGAPWAPLDWGGREACADHPLLQRGLRTPGPSAALDLELVSSPRPAVDTTRPSASGAW